VTDCVCVCLCVYVCGDLGTRFSFSFVAAFISTCQNRINFEDFNLALALVSDQNGINMWLKGCHKQVEKATVKQTRLKKSLYVCCKEQFKVVSVKEGKCL